MKKVITIISDDYLNYLRKNHNNDFVEQYYTIAAKEHGLITPIVASKFHGVSRQAINYMVNDKGINKYRIGNIVFLSVKDLFKEMLFKDNISNIDKYIE